MNAKTDLFVSKVRAKDYPNHKDSNGNLIYGYNKVDYINNYTKVIFVCPKHGDFEQLPSNHLKGRGCSKCASEATGKRVAYSIEDFKLKAISVHKGRYDYFKSDYTNSQSMITVTCRIHGDFNQVASSHLAGNGCPACSGVLKGDLESFIKRASELHKGLYTYERSEYITARIKITITCKLHGDFEQTPDSHLRSRGCPTCAVMGRGYTKTIFRNQCKKNNKGLGILYVIRCFNETESFYKVGITSTSIKTRFSGNNRFPYEYEVIHEVHREPNKIYDMENYLLRELAIYRYQPLIEFKGQTECFISLEPFYELLRAKLAA